MKIFKYSTLFTMVVAVISCSLGFVPNDGFQYTASEAEISRTEGVAPLGVHFVAGFQKNTSGIGEFHNLSYEWNFGDSASGTWGTSGTSRNTAMGPVSAHVFEEPGVYDVSLTVRIEDDIVSRGSYKITVQSPDLFFSGTDTICVSSSGNFSGSPAGSLNITTSDLSSITHHAQAGKRILFRRGDEWTSDGLDFPDNAGPVVLGAFGNGVNPDSQGLYDNAPLIRMTGTAFCDLNNKQDWRIMDLHLEDETWNVEDAFGGVSSMQRILIMNMEVHGFDIPISWGHWNESDLMTIDHMMVVNNHIYEGRQLCFYGGSERFALLGNNIHDADDSHVARVWQAYKGVISNNMISGSSLGTGSGRHSLKLHGPGYRADEGTEHATPVPYTPYLENATEEVVVSDNIFGSSGPWPVMIGPQDQATRTEMYDIIFERNRIISEFGNQNNFGISRSLSVYAKFVTIRNNVIDGSGSGIDFMGMKIGGDNVLPTTDVNVFNNTIYRNDNSTGDTRFGFSVGSDSANVSIKNNIVCYNDFNQNNTLYTTMIYGDCENLQDESNVLTASDPGFIDPDNMDPLSRDFKLDSNSSTINRGSDVPLTFDFSKKIRDSDSIDIGAFEY